MPARFDPTTHLPMHPLEFRILLVLLAGPSHGYRIVQEIEARESGRAAIYPANLYRRIRSLLAAGLVEEVAAPAADEDDRRRYLAVTPRGRSVARAEAERLRELVADARAADLLRPA